MFGYIVRRVISGLLVLLVVSMAVFALFFYGPANPALAYCPETRCTPQRLENITQQLGLDRPVAQQYGEYMKGIVAGNDFKAGAITIKCPAPCLGVSFKLRVNVTDYLMSKFPATLSIALGSAVIFLLVGVSSGIFAARRRGTLADKGIVGVSLGRVAHERSKSAIVRSTRRPVMPLAASQSWTADGPPRSASRMSVARLSLWISMRAIRLRADWPLIVSSSERRPLSTWAR